MLESLKRTILTALKTVALTPEEVRAIIEGFVAEGELTEAQARKVLDALLQPPDREPPPGGGGLGKDLGRLADFVPLVSRSEFRELSERVRSLEERLGPPPKAPEEVPPPSGGVPPGGGDGEVR